MPPRRFAYSGDEQFIGRVPSADVRNRPRRRNVRSLPKPRSGRAADERSAESSKLTLAGLCSL